MRIILSKTQKTILILGISLIMIIFLRNNVLAGDLTVRKDGVVRIKYDTSKNIINSKKVNKDLTDKKVCLYYAKRMMVNDSISLNKATKVEIKTSINKMVNEINNGKPFLIKTTKGNYVLAYGYALSSDGKTVSKFLIIDPVKGIYSDTNEYKVIAYQGITKDGGISLNFEYITIKGENRTPMLKKQVGNKYIDSKGHVFKLYKQDGEKYKNVSYPARGKNATLGKNGCGPTTCAIIASGYGYNDTPKSLVSTGKCYSCYEEIIKYFKDKGFTVKYNYSMDNSDIKKTLNAGYKIVVLTKKGKVGNYNVGNYNHWYTLLDVNGDKVFVGDPLQKRWRMV